MESTISHLQSIISSNPQWLLLLLLPLLLIVTLLARRRSKKKLAKSAAASPWTLGLEKTRQSLREKLKNLWGQSWKPEQFAELEEILISADVGVATTQKLLQKIQSRIASSQDASQLDIKAILAEEILAIFQTAPALELNITGPKVLMIVGVNGAGKTTSIGKLAHYFKKQGKKVLMAAGDTFRAGAIEQLKQWAERVGVPILAPQEGADPAAVAFDAVQSGVSKNLDIVLIDTAGRLHTKVNLMEELKKVKRVMAKPLPAAPHEVWLVLDASQGQNVLQQARQFHEALTLPGLIITKLDGTARGGALIGIVDELRIPVVFVGLGEKMENLQIFEAEGFTRGLLE